MKTLVTIVSIWFATSCYGQITTIIKDVKEEEKKVLRYDSLENLTYENAPLHEGQTLFVLGNKYIKEDGFFDTFYTQIITDSLLDLPPQRINNEFISINRTDYIYKPMVKPGSSKRIVASDYSAFVGKYYKILSIDIEHRGRGDYPAYWFKLIGDDNYPFYLKFNKHEIKNMFITLGYYEKMKQTFVGKDFYCQGSYYIKKADTEENIYVPFKTKFKCIDIAVDGEHSYHIFALLENEKYGKVKGLISKGKELDDFIPISYYNECIKQYGLKFGEAVAEGRVKIGMTRNMVIDAIGYPDKTIRSKGSFGLHEHWLYENRSLYLENGKVTLIID